MRTLNYIALILILLKTCCLLGEGDLPEGKIESYFSRPDVLEQTSIRHEDLPTDWHDFKKGLVEAAAFFVEMYPHHIIYFLARDSEYLYDLVKLLKRDQVSRFKLLNISRANMRDSHVLDYLKQNGINLEAAENKRFLFIDTAFIGQIFDHVKTVLPLEVSVKIDFHLLVSSGKYLDLNIFFNQIEPTNADNEISKELSIKRYEHLPHFSERSSYFQNINGIWHPMSKVIDSGDIEADGKVSKPLAQKLQEDLSFYSKTEAVREQFTQRSSQWRNMRNLLDRGDRNGLVDYIRSLRIKEDKFYFKSLVKDLIDFSQRENPFRFDPPLRQAEFNIPIEESRESGLSNRLVMKKWKPEWDKYYLDPETALRELFRNGEINLLGQLIEHIESYSFFSHFIALLANHENDIDKKYLVRKAILRQSNDLNFILESKFFSNNQNQIIYKEEFNLMKQLSSEELFKFKHYVVDGKSMTCQSLFKKN